MSMRSRLLVLGSGETATACTLSLLANSMDTPMVTMLARDKEYLHELQYGSRMFQTFDRRISVPSNLSFHHLDSKRIDNNDIRGDASFLCVPVTSLGEEEGDVSLSTSKIPILECLKKNHDVPTFVFTRGLSRNGLTPLEHLNHAVKLQMSKLVVVSGPLFAKEWAEVSTPSSIDSDSGINTTTNTISKNDNNGVSLTFAMPDGTTKDALETVQHLTERLWRRESITWLTEPGAADVLSIVNACVPLCGMGAGMVSSEFPASVSAMMSYMQHSISSTEQLVNQVLNRLQGTPLPASAVTTLAMACTNHASREFVFGRRLNYYFRHRDAIRAVFPGNSHESLDATVSGLHMLLTRRSLSSPFYEVLMDAFLTVLRASVAGRGLVRAGVYDYRDHITSEDAPLLMHAKALDDAILAGDEKRFDEARKAVEMAFGHPQASSSSSTS
ncbi:uncharacterized protein TM35_000013430 [Trypanosoma theileri]|uniref:Glycerol-3-phosphate dehydrogenase NAD-dependent N-terminal domain-containing protein n=1 Tax=Trypanosoma theileri TaxID=67003 RepID=A0A1X0P970_9TRYP|nr:uncharacterized protein TM35_000013430 [Trypanosoma theileri]ORC93466.1 hypothetical protein TM35_000013430 [Trypanosoma theileri]